MSLNLKHLPAGYWYQFPEEEIVRLQGIEARVKEFAAVLHKAGMHTVAMEIEREILIGPVNQEWASPEQQQHEMDRLRGDLLALRTFANIVLFGGRIDEYTEFIAGLSGWQWGSEYFRSLADNCGLISYNEEAAYKYEPTRRLTGEQVDG